MSPKVNPRIQTKSESDVGRYQGFYGIELPSILLINTRPTNSMFYPHIPRLAPNSAFHPLFCFLSLNPHWRDFIWRQVEFLAKGRSHSPMAQDRDHFPLFVLLLLAQFSLGKLESLCNSKSYNNIAPFTVAGITIVYACDICLQSIRNRNTPATNCFISTFYYFCNEKSFISIA